MNLSELRAIVASHLDPKTGLRHHSAIHRAVEAWALAGFPGEGWSETVPTEPGRYLVAELGHVQAWNLLADGRWEHSTWARFLPGLPPFAAGALFMPCPQPPTKETS